MCHLTYFRSFLGYQFTTYGWDVLTVTAQSPEDRADPMNMVFPKVTKCTFHKYGPSGTITRHDGLCVLALNIINEKIFVFLWFWLIFLAVITILYLIYVAALISVPSLRRVMVERNAKHDVKVSIKYPFKSLDMIVGSQLPQKNDQFSLVFIFF